MMDRVVALGCIVCGSPAEVHHLTGDSGIGQKSRRVLPLCPPHHRTGGYGVALHAGVRGWEARHGEQIDLWYRVNELLGEEAYDGRR